MMLTNLLTELCYRSTYKFVFIHSHVEHTYRIIILYKLVGIVTLKKIQLLHTVWAYLVHFYICQWLHI